MRVTLAQQAWQTSALHPQKSGVVGTILGNAAQGIRKDSVSISQQGKNAAKQDQNGAGDFLKSLMERKETLKAARTKLLTQGSESDADRLVAKEQLKLINQELETVDSQIKNYMLQKQKDALEGGKDDKKDDADKTREEAQAEQMQTISQAVTSLAAADQLGWTQAVMERSAAHLSEWSENSHSLTASGGNSTQVQLEKLENGISNLQEDRMGLVAQGQQLTEEAAGAGVQAAQSGTENGEVSVNGEPQDSEKTVTEEIQEAVEQERPEDAEEEA